MYELTNLWVLDGREWSELDVPSLKTTKELLREHDDVRIAVRHPHEPKVDVVDLSVYRHRIDGRNITFEQWLESIGEETLIVLGSVEEIMEPMRVGMKDTWEAGYDISYTTVDMHPDVEINENQARDLLIAKEGVEANTLWENFLFTVNGFIHRANPGPTGVYLMDGNFNATRSADNRVAMIDFTKVGGVRYHNISDDTIELEDDALYLTVEEDLSDRTVMMVLGGYLLPLDRYVRSVSDKVFELDLKQYPLKERFVEAREILDLSEFNAMQQKDGQLSPSSIDTREFLVALLNNHNSFLVSVGTKHLYQSIKRLTSDGLPGKYRSDVPVYGMLRFSNGKLAEYKNNGHKDNFVVSTAVEYDKPYIMNTVKHNDDVPLAQNNYAPNDRRTLCYLEEYTWYTFAK